MTVTGERPLPRDDFIQHGTKRKYVGARIATFLFQLLGCKVRERSQHRHRTHGKRPGRRVGHLWRGRRQLSCQAEVEQFDPGFREHHVARLQVAMDDSLTMCALERLGDLNSAGECLIERNLLTREPGGERLALDEFHDEEVGVARFPDVIERADVRMVQLRNDTGFPLESLPELLVMRE
jgi:hypothetical protein